MSRTSFAVSRGATGCEMLSEVQEAARAKRASQSWETFATELTGITCEAFQWDMVTENVFIHLKFLLLKNLKKGLSRQGTTLNDYMEPMKSCGDEKG